MSKENIPYAQLLAEAVSKPGILSACYSRFYTYSLGNQIWLWSQILGRNEELAPVATFKKWASLGRYVRKDEKGLTIAMPVTIKDRGTDETFTTFMLRKCLFTLNQTEGEPYKETSMSAEWDVELALDVLKIEQEAFADLNGNMQGYARGKSFAINPLAVLPHKTRFHELAHIVLGHTKDTDFSDEAELAKDVREVEAESTAYILCNVLSLPGLEESRGYIQNWLGQGSLQDKTAQRIFSAANKILKAGQPQKVEARQETLQKTSNFSQI